MTDKDTLLKAGNQLADVLQTLKLIIPQDILNYYTDGIYSPKIKDLIVKALKDWNQETSK